jgi:hypothetical protein
MNEFEHTHEEEINEFDLRQVDDNPSSVWHIIGAPASGKTHFIQFLFYALKHIYAAAVAYNGSEESQNAYTPLIGGAFTSATYNEHDHKRNISRQVICFKENCEYNKIIHVIDDFGFDKKVGKSKSISKAHKNGSQWLHELQLMGYQSIRDIDESLINSPSKVFIFMEKEDSNRRKIHKAYFKTLIPEYKDFCQLMNDICKKHYCLVVDLRKQSSDLADCVSWFKAPYWVWNDKNDPKDKHPYPKGWRFGCQQFQEWNDTRWDSLAVPDFVKDAGAF